MELDLRHFSDSQLNKILEFTQKLAAENQDEFANFGEASNLEQAHEQALAHIHRRKNNTRQIDDAEDKAIRKQVRKFLKSRGIIKE